jgi:sec-independent protein translocase protein TatA
MPVGPWELILLLVIVLVIFGPGKLPDIGSAVGKGIREFRKASTELESSVRGEPTREKRAASEDKSTQGGGGTTH